jgi:hypothetical protein
MSLKILMLAVIIALFTTQVYSLLGRRNVDDNEFKFDEKQVIDWLVLSANNLQGLVENATKIILGNKTLKPFQESSLKNNAIFSQFESVVNLIKQNLESLSKNITKETKVEE